MDSSAYHFRSYAVVSLPPSVQYKYPNALHVLAPAIVAEGIFVLQHTKLSFPRRTLTTSPHLQLT